MRQIIEALNEIEGKEVDIYTEHKLFGKQHIQMKFVPETELGIGFHILNQIIYIDKDDIISYENDNNILVINGNMMQIKIVQAN